MCAARRPGVPAPTARKGRRATSSEAQEETSRQRTPEPRLRVESRAACEMRLAWSVHGPKVYGAFSAKAASLVVLPLPQHALSYPLGTYYKALRVAGLHPQLAGRHVLTPAAPFLRCGVTSFFVPSCITPQRCGTSAVSDQAAENHGACGRPLARRPGARAKGCGRGAVSRLLLAWGTRERRAGPCVHI